MFALTQELRRAARALWKSRRYALLCALTLALGIGASAAIFQVVHSVLLQPLPFPEPERIVHLWQRNDGGSRAQFSNPNYEDVATRTRSFEALAQFRSAESSVSGGAEPVRVRTAAVSRDFFRVLGVRPLIGRGFDAAETSPGGPAVCLVSEGFWRSSLGERPVDGITLTVNQEPYVVVGVLPGEVGFPDDASVWTARELEPRIPSRTAHNWRVVGRLADGVTLEQAREDASRVAREVRAEVGDDTWMTDAVVLPLHEELVGDLRRPLYVLSAAVSFLLLVAAANAFNLMLARAATRQGEMAVSAALGASRIQLMRPFLMEALLLSAAGGLVGVFVAQVATSALLRFGDGSVAVGGLDPSGMSLPVLGFVVGLTLATALVVGGATALRASRPDLQRSLGERSRGRLGEGLRRALVVAQVALTLVLLAGAGLLGRSLYQLLAVDPGFRSSDVWVMEVALAPPDGAVDRGRLGSLQARLLERLGTLPGVQRVGAVDRLPMNAGFRNGLFLLVQPGETVESFEDFQRLADDPSRVGEAEYRAADGGFFPALGVPLLYGRSFEARDDASAPHVAVVSESLVRTQWPDSEVEEVVGQLIEFGNMDGDLRLLRVVGIVGDVRHGGLDQAARPTIYVNARQRPPASLSVVLQVAGGTEIVAASRRVAREVLPEAAPRFRTMDGIVTRSYGERRFHVVLLAGFAMAALTLATMGVYGIIALGVAARARELSVRVALGARESDVTGLVLRQGARLVLLGLAVGLAIAVALSRYLESLLFNVSATDPWVFAGIVVPLVAAALVATYLPARRAARADPLIALRGD